MKGWKIIRKDQARRLRFQEFQRIQQKLINNKPKYSNWIGTVELPEGQLKAFASKLIK